MAKSTLQTFIQAIGSLVSASVVYATLWLGELVPLNDATRPWLLPGALFGIGVGMFAALAPRTVEAFSAASGTRQLSIVVGSGFVGYVSVVGIEKIIFEEWHFPLVNLTLSSLGFATMAALGFVFTMLAILIDRYIQQTRGSDDRPRHDHSMER